VLTPVGDRFDHTYALPRIGWSYLGSAGANRGYRYRDRTQALGPITLVVVRKGRLLKIAGRGMGLQQSLATDPEPVTIALSAGTNAYCMSFGGRPRFQAGRRFTSTKATAPTVCSR